MFSFAIAAYFNIELTNVHFMYGCANGFAT